MISLRKTGLVTKGCYAARLHDCDGGPLTREHYISKGLLKRFGKAFMVEGLSWLSGAQKLAPKALQSKILCNRHNNALSSLDETIGHLYDVLITLTKGGDVGVNEFNGPDIERWALKVLVGLAVSGSLRGKDGQPTFLVDFPDQYIRILFAHEAMPVDCGLYYIGDPIDELDAGLLNLSIDHYPVGHENAGEVFGITIKLLGIQFITTVLTRIEVQRQRICYHPAELRFREPSRGCIRFRWDPPSRVGLILDVVRPTL